MLCSSWNRRTALTDPDVGAFMYIGEKTCKQVCKALSGGKTVICPVSLTPAKTGGDVRGG